MPHEVAAMSVWQVLGIGEGFVRSGKVDAFELSGFVQAPSAREAASRALSIAKQQVAELTQMNEAAQRWPLINWNEIQEADALALSPGQLDKVELHWASDAA